MTSTQVNPNVNLTEGVAILDTHVAFTDALDIVGIVTTSGTIVLGNDTSIYFKGTQGGGAQGIYYPDLAAGTTRSALLLPGNNIVALCSRGANGITQMRANSTAGSGGEVVVIQAEDDQITNFTYVKQGHFTKVLDGDTTATPMFTITTTNETGSADGGSYACFIKILGISAAATPSTGNHAAAMAAEAIFVRAVNSTGGANSAVTEVTQTASAATGAATRDVANITVTVTETSEYVQTVNIAVDSSGTSLTPLYASVWVELIWHGFLTAPVLAQSA